MHSGIPKDIVDRIFDPFFTTKPTGEDTGLGLSMVYGFVRQSGGQIKVESEVGSGTTFCLYLPRHFGDADIETISAPAVPEVSDGQLVLIIDDEPTVRMLISEILSDVGYRVLEAEDGPSGLRILSQTPGVDLLVTDVGLPGGMNGRQVADAARVAQPGLKVLFVTSFAESVTVGKGHMPPGMTAVTKPFSLDDFANKVSEILAS